MQLVEYSHDGRLSRTPVGPRLLKTGIRTVEEAEAEIKRLLVDCQVVGYCQEQDYHWGRGRAPGSELRMLKIEA